MAKHKIVSREELEQFYTSVGEGPVTWLYVKPFYASGLMLGSRGYVPADELFEMAEQYVMDTEGTGALAVRLVYDGDGKVAGMLYEERELFSEEDK